MALMPLRLACTGVPLFDEAEPLPSSPSLLSPQVQTVPSLLRAMLKMSPAATAVAELAVAVRAPGPDGPVALDGQGVVVPGGDRGHAGQSAHLHRGAAVGRRPVAELPGVVETDRPDGAVALQNEGRVLASDDLR